MSSHVTHSVKIRVRIPTGRKDTEGCREWSGTAAKLRFLACNEIKADSISGFVLAGGKVVFIYAAIFTRLFVDSLLFI